MSDIKKELEVEKEIETIINLRTDSLLKATQLKWHAIAVFLVPVAVSLIASISALIIALSK